MLLLSLFFYIAWRGRGAIRAYAVHRDRISIEGRDVDIPFDKINDIAVSSPPCRWLHDGAYYRYWNNYASQPLRALPK